jgi:hypothetical protein
LSISAFDFALTRRFVDCHIESHADKGMMQVIQVMLPPTVDVAFVASIFTILGSIFLASTSYLARQWYIERSERLENNDPIQEKKGSSDTPETTTCTTKSQIQNQIMHV